MKLRTALGLAAGGLAAAALIDRVLANRAGALPDPLPGERHTAHWRGMDVSYTEAGDPNDPDVVLLHGIHAGASSQEFEPIVDQLAERFHVVVPDLPGFGRSDRPPLVYSDAIYEDFVRDFVRDYTDDPVIVASSLTGAYTLATARDRSVERLVLICPTADTTARRPWLRSLLRIPVVGTALFDLLASKPSMRYFFVRDSFYDPNAIDGTLEYAWRSAHQPGARFAPASFVGGDLDPAMDLPTALAEIDVPVTLVWGRDAERVPLREGRDLAEAADTDLVVVDFAKLLPHVEHPETFVEYLSAELPWAEHD